MKHIPMYLGVKDIKFTNYLLSEYPEKKRRGKIKGERRKDKDNAKQMW